MATDLYGEAIARIVSDPQTAAALVPSHPFGCKRPIIDQGYYETFNRDNVTLVDLRADPLKSVTPNGIDTEHGHHDLDVIIYATGFDAMTGALTRIDIHGRGGALLRDVWADEAGGLSGAGGGGLSEPVHRPGAGQPSAATNFVAAMEQHVEWIGDCITLSARRRLPHHRGAADAQREWIEHDVARRTDGSGSPTCNSWYNGANVPGKKRMYMGYTAGIPSTAAGATRWRPTATPVRAE